MDLDEHLAELFALLDARWESLPNVDAIDVDVHDRDESTVFVRVNLHSFVQTPTLDERAPGQSKHSKKALHSILSAIYESHQTTTIDPFTKKRRAKNSAELAVDAESIKTLKSLYDPTIYSVAHDALDQRKLSHPHAASFVVLGNGHSINPHDTPSNGRNTKHLYFTSDEKPSDILAELEAFTPLFLDMHRQQPKASDHVNKHPVRGDAVVRTLSAWRVVFSRPS